MRESCGPDALLGERALLGAERCGGYGAAGADFEDAVGRLDVRVVGEALQSAPLGVFERLGGGAGVGFGQSYRARVCHVWGGEGSEHVIADVVVGVDVELGVFEAVASSGYSREAVAHGGGECGATG